MSPERADALKHRPRQPFDFLPTRARWIVTAVMVGLATITFAAVILGAWANHVLLDEDRFSARIASTLREDEMNAYLAEELTEQVLARAPELMGVRPAIEAVLSEALRTRTAIVGARAALRAAHRNVRAGIAEEAIAIDLEAVFTLAAALMQRGAPDVADRFEAGLDTARIDAGAVGLRTGLFDGLGQLTAFMWPLVGLSVAFVIGIIGASPSRRIGLLLGAVTIGIAGIAGIAGQALAEAWLVERFPAGENARQAVTLAWRSVLREYRGWNSGLVALGLAGVVGVLASSQLPDKTAVRGFFAQSAWGRTLVGGSLAVVGVAVARWPLDAVRVIVVAAGVLVAGVGLLVLLRNAIASAQEIKPTEYAQRVWGKRLLIAAYAVIAMGVTGIGVSIWYVSTVTVEPSPVEPATITVCNGSELLCDRPLDQVTFAGTHNSMAAAAERGWFYPAQRHGIAQQLRDGVRALLIDTYYGIRSPQGVLTVDYDVRRPELVASHGEEVVSAAERIAARLQGDGEREIFLCHSFCELGATPFGASLVDIRDYLDANPSEFLVLIIQDLTSPEDVIQEFELADLAERAYAHPPGRPWPTLGELLNEGRQLLVLAENRSGAAAWYQQAFDAPDSSTPGVLGDTALGARAIEELQCDGGRGDVERPLFLMNHWVDREAALPSTALTVNAAPTLLDRARGCTDAWGRLPNIVAVDFYDVGDLFAVVDVLNGVVPETEIREATSP